MVKGDWMRANKTGCAPLPSGRATTKSGLEYNEGAFCPQSMAFGYGPSYRDYPTLFKVVFHTKVVCQKIQHIPLVIMVTFSTKKKNIA